MSPPDALIFFAAFLPPKLSSKTTYQDYGGSALRTGTSFVVIGFALAGAISSAAAQYFPPQPPPAGYPPSAHYPYPANPPPPYQRADPYLDTDGEPYGDPYDRPYPAQP